jgi:uncharacterized alkaline shock family protein YloU
MSITITEDIGAIVINNDVLARLAGLAASSCYGVVGMSVKSVKDGIVHLLKRESLSKGVEIRTDEDNNISVCLHIIVEYGTNIHAIGDVVASTVRYKLEESLELPVESVRVVVEGVRADSDHSK